LLGDLNTVPPGCKDADFPHGGREPRSYRGDRTLAILAAAGLRMVPHEDSAAFWTHPTGIPNRTLDYILFSHHWSVENYGVLPSFTLTDHYPVEGCFRLRPR
jgi:endonuclease/exonuclease/phosphatase family metal-dependent hydrolase